MLNKNKKNLFINNFLIEIRNRKFKPGQNIFDLVQHWYGSLLRINQGMDQIFSAIIPHIYLSFSFSTVAHGLSTLKNLQRKDLESHIILICYHLFYFSFVSKSLVFYQTNS
jgi:hypothetical protein